ncbi:putative Lachesin, partial [Operophtera brumata]
VGWLRAEDQTVLSLHEHVVLGPRYTISVDSGTWQLRIRPLRAEDRGCYMCQINTQPASGHPSPKITWRREDHEPMLLKRMGAFLCIASNDVPPAVSKRITLLVNCEYATERWKWCTISVRR